MFRLKIIVRVQTFRRGPPVPPHNFCHPGLEFVVILQPTLSIPYSGFATSPQLSHLLDIIARHFTLDVIECQ